MIKNTSEQKVRLVLFPSIQDMRFYLFTIGIILFSLPVIAQSVKVAYYGETVVHYGLKAGLEYQLGEKYKPKDQADTIKKAFIFSPSVALYHHRQNHTGLIVAPEFFYRRTGRAGGLFDVGISPSFFRYFLSGTTYEVNDDEGFSKVPLAGRNTFLPTVFIGIGKDLSKKHRLPISWYTRLNFSAQYPYNASILPRFALEAGLIKKLNTLKPSRNEP